MDQKSKHLSFKCANCAKDIPYESYGTKNRNHCLHCLNSLHVDNEVGDRASGCNGLMPAIGKIYKDDGEEVLVHKCDKCGQIRKNRVAGDDSVEVTNSLAIVELSEVM